jgi:hypothetical protein
MPARAVARRRDAGRVNIGRVSVGPAKMGPAKAVLAGEVVRVTDCKCCPSWSSVVRKRHCIFAEAIMPVCRFLNIGSCSPLQERGLAERGTGAGAGFISCSVRSGAPGSATERPATVLGEPLSEAVDGLRLTLDANFGLGVAAGTPIAGILAGAWVFPGMLLTRRSAGRAAAPMAGPLLLQPLGMRQRSRRTASSTPDNCGKRGHSCQDVYFSTSTRADAVRADATGSGGRHGWQR